MEKADNGKPTSAQSAEYRFIHQRIPQHLGRQRFLMPILLLAFEFAFIILFAVFANYQSDEIMRTNEDVFRIYPMFQDIHVFVILGIGFIMTFLKRYGYGSLGFNLLLSAFVMQWSLLVRGWIEWNVGKGQFMITIKELIIADFTTLSILISFGAVLGKTTSAQLVTMAIFGVLAQVVNEYINASVFQAHDIGKGMYVHLFGAMFGLGVSKTLNFNKIQNSKQKSVYHSDLFAFIGTLFLWVFFPSLNSVFAEAEGQTKAIVNTYLAITASTVVTVAISSLYGNGKINVMHVQHSTLAGGVAISAIADVNLQCYVALLIGATAGLLSTIGFQVITKSCFNAMRLHDTCGVFNLHGIPGILAGMSGVVFAAATMLGQYKNKIFHVSRFIFENSTIISTNTTNATIDTNLGALDPLTGRTSGVQAGYQLAALAITFSFSLFTGAIVGLFLRMPIFDQIVDDLEMFDDELQWKTPDDYALKLTLAPSSTECQDVEMPLVNMGHLKAHEYSQN